MEITTSKTGDSIRMQIWGEIDEAGAKRLKSEIESISPTTTRNVTLDFGDVTHIGSAGLGQLLMLYKKIAIHGGSLEIERVPNAIYNIFNSTKLDTIFAVGKI